MGKLHNFVVSNVSNVSRFKRFKKGFSCSYQFLCPLLRLNDLVAPLVELGVVHLQLGMGKDIVDAAANALVEAGRGLESGNGTLQLGAVEDDRSRLVADEGPPGRSRQGRRRPGSRRRRDRALG